MDELDLPKDTAQRALVVASVASAKLDSHEKVCAARWKVVVRTNFFMVGALLSVLAILLKPQFFS